ncbi:MAG: hypothetical protein JNG86_10740 [Verrucomicrobiaceae bacterium]|nr:hypothetical protein [Verrucomicrobiaceae bacterium]
MFAAARWLVVFCLMVSIGLHTVVIQSTAWAGMLVEFTLKTGSVTQAVSDTFDGEHGCPMCKLAQQTAPTSGDDKQAPDAGGKLKTHLIADSAPVIVIAALPPPTFAIPADAQAHLLPQTPEAPPPRFLAA